MISKPIERMVVRYEGVPPELSHIVRLEKPTDEAQIRANILHNALARYFVAKFVTIF